MIDQPDGPMFSDRFRFRPGEAGRTMGAGSMAATLKDVAALTGVSIRTAGRALRGDGPVRPEVAEKILAAARQLNYVPNAAARSLRRRSGQMVGIIASSGLSAESGQRKLRLLEEELRANGRYVLLGAYPDTVEEFEQLLRDWTGLVAHVVLFGWAGWNFDFLHRYPLRFIFVDRLEPSFCGFDNLRIDRARGAEAAVRALIDAGARRIVHVSSNTSRLAGVAAAIAGAAGKVAAVRIEAENQDLFDGYRLGELVEKQQPDAVFFDTDRLALGFYRYAYERGIRIPQDVAVAGFDDDSAGAYAIPTLTTVRHPDREIARSAVEIVTGPADAPPRTRDFPTELIRRESSG